MSGFDPNWLALREPRDAKSRSEAIIALLGKHRDIVDLGAGTAANLRFLAPKLGARQHWLLVDMDEALLDRSRRALKSWAKTKGAKYRSVGDQILVDGSDFNCSIDTRKLDMSREMREFDLPKGCLVTVSALLDLVSERWLADLVSRCTIADASCLFALSYDGTIAIDPATPEDAAISSLVNTHQQTDKGFGPALGPDAWIYARTLLEHAGYSVNVVHSDWQCGPSDSKLQRALIDGWAAAALEVAPDDSKRIEAWRKSRRGQIRRRELEILVGHRDLVATPN